MQWKKTIFVLCLLFTATLSAMEEDPYSITFKDDEMHYLRKGSNITLKGEKAKILNQWLKLFPKNEAVFLHKDEEGTFQVYHHDFFSINYGDNSAGLRIVNEIDGTLIKLNEVANKNNPFREDKIKFLRKMIGVINIYLAAEEIRAEIPSYIPFRETLIFLHDHIAGLNNEGGRLRQRFTGQLWSVKLNEFIEEYRQYSLPLEATDDIHFLRNGSYIVFTSQKAKILNQWLSLFRNQEPFELHKNEHGIFQVYRNANAFSVNYGLINGWSTAGFLITVEADQTKIEFNVAADDKYRNEDAKKKFSDDIFENIRLYLKREKKRVEFPSHISLEKIYQFLREHEEAVQKNKDDWRAIFTEEEFWRNKKTEFIANNPQ